METPATTGGATGSKKEDSMPKAKKTANRKKVAKKVAKKKTSTSKKRPPSIGVEPLLPKELRWECVLDKKAYPSTDAVEPLTGVVAQQTAIDAIRFGLETSAPGHNIFVRGLSGTGRLTLVRWLLEEIQPSCPLAQDRCFVHNFSQPDRPRLITLPPGRGQAFKKGMEQLAEFIKKDLGPALSSDEMKARRGALDQQAKSAIQGIVQPLESALKAAGLALVTYQAGPVAQTAIFPVAGDKPVPPEEFEQLHAQGQVPDEQFEAFKQNASSFEKQLEETNERVTEIRRNHEQTVRELMERSARWVLNNSVRGIERDFPQPSVLDFLNELIDDLIEHRLTADEKQDDFTQLYRVNVVLEHKESEGCPIIAEASTSVRDLLGTIDYEFGPGGEAQANHMGIRAGNLLNADGGFLILEVRDLLGEPEAWKTLVRTLRTGKLEIVPANTASRMPGPSLKPEPIPINVKVVLLGDTETYYFLDVHDKDFSQLFKVLADFDSLIARDNDGVRAYAQVLARICSKEDLPAFEHSALTALTEQGARVASRGGKLTTQFGRIADIAREAAFLTVKNGRARVTGKDVAHAILKGKQRADLPSRHFRELIGNGTIRVVTRGKEVGQINGLAVMKAGPLIYGFPARITATIGPGTAGVINIEREAALSGAIHTKGFYILGGLLRQLLRTDHPLAFDASIAFEQSYGGIDGDSASGAEICCLLSALTNVPLRQDLAMTGAIDQMGHILAIGAVNEKIEGFFDTCADGRLRGTQGVIIPRSNANDLMLRDDVVAACAKGKFSIYAVETVHEALELFTGVPAGRRGRNGAYPEDSLLRIAVDRARQFWSMASITAPAAKKGGPGGK